MSFHEDMFHQKTAKTYYVIFQVDLYDEEPTKENILPLFEGLEYDDLLDSFVSIEKR